MYRYVWREPRMGDAIFVRRIWIGGRSLHCLGREPLGQLAGRAETRNPSGLCHRIRAHLALRNGSGRRL